MKSATKCVDGLWSCNVMLGDLYHSLLPNIRLHELGQLLERFHRSVVLLKVTEIVYPYSNTEGYLRCSHS